jgi:hypothetical protein
MVNAEPAWGARVVYGDTDSLFVLLEDRSRSDAFRIGEEIAARASAMFPDPVTLKFEKVGGWGGWGGEWRQAAGLPLACVRGDTVTPTGRLRAPSPRERSHPAS